jgi:hypothetical protein
MIMGSNVAAFGWVAGLSWLSLAELACFGKVAKTQPNQISKAIPAAQRPSIVQG